MLALMRWFKTWWLTIPEPRAFSIGWGFAYAMLGCGGASVLIAVAAHPAGDRLMFAAAAAVGLLNIVGMLVAMISGYRDFWWGERLGISAMLGATCIYMWLMPSHDVIAPWYVGFAIVILCLRWLMIRRFTYRPRG